MVMCVGYNRDAREWGSDTASTGRSHLSRKGSEPSSRLTKETFGGSKDVQVSQGSGGRGTENLRETETS